MPRWDTSKAKNRRRCKGIDPCEDRSKPPLSHCTTMLPFGTELCPRHAADPPGYQERLRKALTYGWEGRLAGRPPREYAISNTHNRHYCICGATVKGTGGKAGHERRHVREGTTCAWLRRPVQTYAIPPGILLPQGEDGDETPVETAVTGAGSALKDPHAPAAKDQPPVTPTLPARVPTVTLPSPASARGMLTRVIRRPGGGPRS